MLLNNKSVLITGAKGGLGTFVTNAFLDAGARVIEFRARLRIQISSTPRS